MHKKAFLPLMLLLPLSLALAGLASADPILYENYNRDNWGDADVSLYGTNWSAQTFTTIETTHSITQIKLRMYRVGNPGTLTVSIRDVDEYEHPTSGPDLTVGTIDADTFGTSTAGLFYTISVNEINLDGDTKYAIVLRALDGDVSNTVHWWGFWSSPLYLGGDLCTSSDSGASWEGLGGFDMIFEIHGFPELQWYEVETWTNYLNQYTADAWHEVETWTNYVEAEVTPYSWLDDRLNWGYSKMIYISGDYPEDYQFRIFLEMSDDLGDNALENFDDLRFVSFDNATLFNHWVENKNDGENVLVWFKKSDNVDNCYVYYGNPDALNWENGTGTFEYFGAGESLSEWSQSNGTWTIENGVYQQTDNTADAWQDGLKLNTPPSPTNADRIVGVKLKAIPTEDSSSQELWWDSDMKNRRMISFSPNTLENYQVKIVLPFYDNTIRFLENINAGPLSHWTENHTNDNMTVWVRRLENTDENIYVYYSHSPGTVSTENGDDVFILFDNFDGDSVDETKWTLLGGGGTVANGIYTAVDDGEGIKSNDDWADSTVAFRSSAKIAENNAGIIEWAVPSVRPGAYIEYGDNVHRAITVNDPSGEDITALGESAGTWFIYELRRPASDNQHFYLDDVLDVVHDTYDYSDSLTVGFRAYADVGGQVEVDWMCIRTFIGFDSDPDVNVGESEPFLGDTYAAYSSKFSNPTNWLHTELRVGLASGFRGMSKIDDSEGSVSYTFTSMPLPDSWYRMTTKIYEDNVFIELYHDNGDYESIGFIDDNWDQAWIELNLHTHYSEGLFDNIFVAKYILPEPSIGFEEAENVEGAWYEVGTWTNSIRVEVYQPILVTPENRSTTADTTPTFTWDNGVNADNHWFVLDDNEDFESTIENLVVQTETYTSSTLSPGTYWWKVIAENATSTTESLVWTFSIYQQLELWGIEGIDTFETALYNIPAKWIQRADWLSYHPSMWENVTQLSVPFGYMAAYWDTALTIYAGLYNENWMENVIGQFNAYCWMIENFGYIPNVIYHDGPYVWSIGRSQPPYFMSVAWKIFTSTNNTDLLYQGYYWGKLELENFWSRTSLADKQGHDYDRPRYYPEYGLYVYDSGTDTGNTRRKLAAFESGLDDHARWDTPSENVWEVFPVGLNAMMYYNYQTLATMGGILNDRGYSIPGDELQSWTDNADNIKDAMNLYMWDDSEKWYYDYNINTSAQTGVEALDSAIVLFAEMVDNENARNIADHLKSNYLDGYVSPSTTTIEFNGVRPSFAEGRLWEYNRSLPPVKQLVYEGLKKYRFVGYEDFDAYLANVATGREGVNATTGAGEKGGEFPWGYVTTFLPPIQDKIGFTYDLRENEIKFIPMSYIDNGMGGRLHIYDHSPIEVTFNREANENLSFNINADGQTFKLTLLLYFDLSTNIQSFYVVKDDALLDVSKYEYVNLDEDAENEGILITDNEMGAVYELSLAQAWFEVETWSNRIRWAWYEIETWTNYLLLNTWYEVGTWTNYIGDIVWNEVGTWTNYIDASPPGWHEVGTWTNYFNPYISDTWYEVGTWTNYIEIDVIIPPEAEPSVWVTIIRILGIVVALGYAGWRFKLVDDPVTGIHAGLTVVIAIIVIVIVWFVAGAVGQVAAGL